MTTQGVLLPVHRPRARSTLKTVAAVTVFAFTLTSVVPPGWAWPSKSDQTMRVEQGLESDAATGLEEQLVQPPSVPPAPRPLPVSDNGNFWNSRQAPTPSGLEEISPPAQGGPTRREFLKASVAAVVGGAVLSNASRAQAQAPGIEPAPATLDGSPQFNPGVGAVAADQPNTFVIDLQGGTIFGPEGKYVETVRGSRSTRRFWDAAQQEVAQKIQQLMAAVSERTGVRGGPISEDRLQGVWNAPAAGGWAPATFSPAVRGKELPISYQPQRSYTIWAPQMIDKGLWPAIFQGLRKSAGLRPDEVGKGYHTRLYVDPYGMLEYFRSWPVEDVREFLELARRNGVQIVPILGDPTMALYPDDAVKMIRSLFLTGLFPPDGDGIRRISLDIEPNHLPGYYKKNKVMGRMEVDEAQAEVYWANVLRIVEETRTGWSHRMAQAAFDDHRDMEITLFVPPHFFGLVQKRKLKVPQRTRLMLMAHSDSPERMAQMAAEARLVMERDAALPEEQQLFGGVTLGVQADISAARTEDLQGETLWRDPAKPYAEPVGKRTSDAGKRVSQALQGADFFNEEYCVHTADVVLDLLPFLVQGGVDAEWMADREVRSYLARLSRAASVASQFLSAIPYESPPSKYGQLPNGRSAEEITADYIFLLAQRFSSGAIGTGAIIAHWLTVYDTLVQSWRRGGFRLRFHPDLPLLTPDIGIGYAFLRMGYSSQFGEGGQIHGVATTIVDPSQLGEPILDLNPKGEQVRGGRRVNPDTGKTEVLVTGWAGNPKSPGENITVRPSDVVLGTRLPDGQIVPGRAVVLDPDSLVDSTSERRKENGRRIVQVPSNGYDFYWTVHLRNPGKDLHRGYVRIYPHAGSADPVELSSDNMDLKPGESRQVTLSVRAGYNHNGDLADADSRSNPDPFARKSQLDLDRMVNPAIFYINAAGSPEISDAVGVSAYDPTFLAAQAVEDPRRRKQLLEETQRMIQEASAKKAPLSELNYYAPGRSLGVRLRLDPGGDPEALVRSVTGFKEQHGVTHLVVEAPDLLALVDEYRRLRGDKKKRGVIGFVEGSVEAMKMVNRIWASHPGAHRIRRLLREAREQGLQVSFLINAADASQHGDAEVLGGDKTGAVDFFRILKNLTETYTVGLDTTYHTVVENWDSLGEYADGRDDPALRRENQAWVARLYANASASLQILSDSDAPAPLEIDTAKGIFVSTPRVHDLTPMKPPDALNALEAVQMEARPLGLALLTPEQCRSCPPLEDAQRLVNRLIGDPKDAKDPTANRVVTSLWLAQQLSGLAVHRTAVDQLVLERVLNLRLVVPAGTGHFSVPAQRFHATPTRDMLIRLRLFHEGEGRLYSMEYPIVGDREVDLSKEINFHVTGMPSGIWVVNAEIIGAPQNPVFPNEPNVANLPLVQVEGDPSFHPINSVDPEVDAWIPVGSRSLRFNPEKPAPVEVVVDGQKKTQYLEDRWAVTVRTGDQGEGVLHVGRDSMEEKLLFWLEGEEDQAKEITQWGDSTGSVMVGGVRVGVRMQGGPEDNSRGRVQLEIDRRWVDLWDHVDQRSAARWDRRVIVGTEHSGIQITARPSQSVPGAVPLVLTSSVPDLASGLPETVRDTTEETVITYPHLSEGAGRLAGRVLLGAGLLIAAKSAWDGLVRAVRRADRSALTPHRSNLTRNPGGWLSVRSNPILKFLRVTAITRGMFFLLMQVPPIPILLGLGSWASGMGVLIKLGIGVPLCAKWLRDGVGALVPQLSNWVNAPARYLIPPVERRVPDLAAGPLERLIAGPSMILNGAGMAISSLANMGRLVWMAVVAYAAFAIPMAKIAGGVAAGLSWMGGWVPVAFLGTWGTALTQWLAGAPAWLSSSAGRALWALGGKILGMKLTATAFTMFGISVTPFGVICVGVGVLGTIYLISLARHRGVDGFMDLGAKAMLSGAVVTALALAFGGLPALAAVSVYQAVQWLIVFQVARFCSRFLAETGYLFSIGVGITALAIAGGAPAGIAIGALLGAYTLADILLDIIQAVLAANQAHLPPDQRTNVRTAIQGGLRARGVPFPDTIEGGPYSGPPSETAGQRAIRERANNWAPFIKNGLASAHALAVAYGFAALLAWVKGGGLATLLSNFARQRVAEGIATTLTSPILLQVVVAAAFVLLVLKWIGATPRKLFGWIMGSFFWPVRPSQIGSAGVPVLDALGNQAVDPATGEPQVDDRRMSKALYNVRMAEAVHRMTMRESDDFVRNNVAALGLLAQPAATAAAPFPALNALIAANPAQAQRLIRGNSFRVQEATQMFQMDFGAEMDAGMLNWAVPELMRRLEMSPAKQCALPAIFTKPRGRPATFQAGLHYFYYGGGVVVFPVLWFSQGLQYVIAMDFRFLRGFQEEQDTIVLLAGKVSSDMENDPESFINLVMGRWLEGHKEVVMEMLAGQTFHEDPNTLFPREYERRYHDMEELRRVLRARADAGGPDALDALIQLHYVNEPDTHTVDDLSAEANLVYGIGPLGRPTHLVVREWNDAPQEGGPDPISDEDSIATRLMDAGHWLIRILGLKGNYLYPPISFSIKETVKNGVTTKEVVQDRHPGKFQVEFRWGRPDRQGRREDLGTPTKAYWMGTGIEIMNKRIPFHPQVTAAGEIEFVSPYVTGELTSPPGPGKTTDLGKTIKETEIARRGVVEAGVAKKRGVQQDREDLRKKGSDAHWDAADRMYGNGQWYGPGKGAPPRQPVVGPFRGHQRYDSLHGRWLKSTFLLGDVLTLRILATHLTFMGWLKEPRKNILQVLRSALYWVSPWAGPLVGILMLTSVIGTPIWWLPWVLFLSSRLVIDPVMRSPQHVISFFGPRKQAVSDPVEASADPAEAIRLTRMATEGVAVKATTGNRLRELPDGTDDAQYTKLVQQGEGILRSNDLYDLVLEMARSVSPEQYRDNLNNPRSVWERTLALRIRWGLRGAGIRRGTPDFIKIQQAILQIIQREHFAVGEPIPRDLYSGTRDPNAQTVGLGSVPTSEGGYGAPGRVRAWLSRFGIHFTRGRTWAMVSEAVNVVPRVPSRFLSRREEEQLQRRIVAERDATAQQGLRDQLEARRQEDRNWQQQWVGIRGNPADPPGTAYLNFYRDNSHLQVDADEMVRQAGLRSRDQYRWWMLWLSPQLRYSGMMRQGDDPKRLGGTAAIMAGVAATVGFGFLKWGLALAGIAVSPPISLGLLAAFVAGSLFFDNLLYEASHWLDHLHRFVPERWWGGRVQWLTQNLLQWGNRVGGAAASLGIGYGLAITVVKGVMAAAAGWGGMAAFGALISGVAVMVIAVVSIRAAVAAFLSMRWDMEVERDQGPAGLRSGRGDGIRAISLIPGLLVQYPLAWLYRTVVLSLNSWLPEAVTLSSSIWIGVIVFGAFGGILPAVIAGLLAFWVIHAVVGSFAWIPRLVLGVPWSLDVYIETLRNGMLPYSLNGLVDQMEYPLAFGSAYAPGKLMWRVTLWWRRITSQEASDIPAAVLLRLKHEPFWTRILSGMNLLFHRSRDFGKALAEDTLLGWMLALKSVGEPYSPAVSAHKLNHIQWRTQERRNSEGSVKRSYQLYKGMGLAHAIREMGGSEASSLEQFVAALTGLVQREQVLTGARAGAGVYGYLFAAFSARQLYTKLVGIYAPGELDALYTYLYYEARDRELNGALARQLFQMNQDHPLNPLVGRAFIGGTLSDEAVREQLIDGWAVDPRGSVAAAKAAVEKGLNSIPDTSEAVDLRNVLVRTMGGFWGTYQLDPIESNARQRRTVDLLHIQGKHRFIRLKSELIDGANLVRAHPVGTDSHRLKVNQGQVAQFPHDLQVLSHAPRGPPVDSPDAVSPVSDSAGLEEATRKDAQRILSEFYQRWAALKQPQKTALIDYYLANFDIGYREFKEMMSVLTRRGVVKAEYDLDDPAYPAIKRRAPGDVLRGKKLVAKTAFLMGAGGAGGRLFEPLEKLSRMQKVLSRFEQWNTQGSSERERLFVDINRLLDEENKERKKTNRPLLVLLPDVPAEVSAAQRGTKTRWLRREILSLRARLIEDLDLGRGKKGLERLQSLLARMEDPDRKRRPTKPTFSLGEAHGRPSPLQIWLETLAQMDSAATVVIGVSDITEEAIVHFLRGALEGRHGSPKGTYFGLKGPIALVSDAVVPVVDVETEKLALDLDGKPLAGAAGGAGSFIALSQPIRILRPSGRVTPIRQTGFEWLHRQGKKYLYIGDADTVGTTPDLVCDALVLMERHRQPAVAVAYPSPGPNEKGEFPPRGSLVNVTKDKGTPDERRVMINVEAKAEEIARVRGLKEAIAEMRAQGRHAEIPANSGSYLITLEALEPMVQEGFPWRFATRTDPVSGRMVYRFELQKPDLYELLAKSTKQPLYIPIAPVEDGQIIPIKDPPAVAKAAQRYQAIAKELRTGLEEEVADANLARELAALIARETQKGVIPEITSVPPRTILPGIPAWVQYDAVRQRTEKPRVLAPGECCVLDEDRLRAQGEEGFVWQGWNMHAGIPMVYGQAIAVAPEHGIRPMDEIKMRQMARLAGALPGYLVIENYSRRIPETGEVLHMGRSVPQHDHLNLIPLRYPLQDLPENGWQTIGEGGGVTVRRAVGYLARVRLVEGTDLAAVARTAMNGIRAWDLAIKQQSGPAIDRQPGPLVGYDTAVVAEEGRIRAYIFPRSSLTHSHEAVHALNRPFSWGEYLNLPDADRGRYFYVGMASNQMLGGIHTPDPETWQRLTEDPVQGAQIVTEMINSVSTPEEFLLPLDAAFLAGLEEAPAGISRREFLRRGAFAYWASVAAWSSLVPEEIAAAAQKQKEGPQGALAPLVKRLGPDKQMGIVVWGARDIIRLSPKGRPGFFEKAVRAGVNTVWISGYTFVQYTATEQQAILNLANLAGLKTLGFIDGAPDSVQAEERAGAVSRHYKQLTDALRRLKLGAVQVEVARDDEPYIQPRETGWNGDLSGHMALLKKAVIPPVEAFRKEWPKNSAGPVLTRFEPFWYRNGPLEDGLTLRGLSDIPGTVIAGMTYRNQAALIREVSKDVRARVLGTERVKFLLGGEMQSLGEEDKKGEMTFFRREAEAGREILEVYDSFSKEEQEAMGGVFLHFSSVVHADRVLDDLLKSGLEESFPLMGPAVAADMAPDEVRAVAESLARQAVSADVDAAIAAQMARMRLRDLTFQQAVERFSSAPVRGWTPPEGPQAVVFLFDDPANVGWAPVVARSGAPVAVITQTSFEAEGMIKLLEKAGVPEGRFAVEALDFHGGDANAALKALEQSFSRHSVTGVALQPVPRTADLDEMERFFKPYGISLGDAIPLKIEVDRYLGSLA